jgi:copper chaperone
MVTFEVQDMTCGHCVSSITKAVRAIDQGAQVTADLATHRVQIEPTQSDRSQLSDAIREAGYTPVPIADAEMAVGQPAPRSGCCCR